MLPDFINDNPDLTAIWDVVYDARGHFLEPHTGVEVPLGTLEVRQYLRGSRKDAPRVVRGLFPTRRFGDRFGAVLFIEKEGFFPLFHRVRLADRYDLAIMSTKGMSVVAARQLVDQICGACGIPLLVLHDFDRSGFSIFGTLSKDNRRYVFKHHFHVIDLGLRLKDVQACGLEAERVVVSDTWKARRNLQRNGATQDEIQFLMKETFGTWRDGQHDALVLAVALACWWAERNPPLEGSAFGGGGERMIAKAPKGVFLT